MDQMQANFWAHIYSVCRQVADTHEAAIKQADEAVAKLAKGSA